jgi:rod shape-determining protein MreD
MTYLIGFPLLLLAAVLQSTVLSQLTFFGGTLNLVLLMALSWTLSGEGLEGVVWGFTGGLFLDVLSGGPLGASALALVLMTFFAGLTEGRFWRSHLLLPLATALLGSLGFHIISLFALFFSGHPVAVSQALWQITLPSLLVNTLGMLPVYRAVHWMHGFVYPAPVTL